MKNVHATFTFLKEQWFKICVLAVLVFIAFILYGALVIRPQKDAELRAAEATTEAEQAKDDESTRQSNIDTCLQKAYSVYSENWDQSCKTAGLLSSRCEALLFDDHAYSEYMEWHPELKNKTITEQLDAFVQAKTDCSCSLPSATSDRWDATYKEDQQACYDRYK